MASPPTHNAGPSPDQGSQTLLSAPLRPPRPLRRQGAQFFEEEQAERDLEEAMMRSSSPLPESVLGKRALQDDDDRDGNDTEPDDGASPVPLSRSGPAPLTTNISVASQRYAVKKKLRPEQRSEVDTFTLVSIILFYWHILCADMSTLVRTQMLVGKQSYLRLCWPLKTRSMHSSQQHLPGHYQKT